MHAWFPHQIIWVPAAAQVHLVSCLFFTTEPPQFSTPWSGQTSCWLDWLRSNQILSQKWPDLGSVDVQRKCIHTSGAHNWKSIPELNNAQNLTLSLALYECIVGNLPSGGRITSQHQPAYQTFLSELNYCGYCSRKLKQLLLWFQVFCKCNFWATYSEHKRAGFFFFWVGQSRKGQLTVITRQFYPDFLPLRKIKIGRFSFCMKQGVFQNQLNYIQMDAGLIRWLGLDHTYFRSPVLSTPIQLNNKKENTLMRD